MERLIKNLTEQLHKVIKEHPIEVDNDTYWRGVKIGLETAINYSQCCKSDSEQFYCLAKIHYPEMVGDEGCDEQCVRCKLKGQ